MHYISECAAWLWIIWEISEVTLSWWGTFYRWCIRMWPGCFKTDLLHIYTGHRLSLNLKTDLLYLYTGHRRGLKRVRWSRHAVSQLQEATCVIVAIGFTKWLAEADDHLYTAMHVGTAVAVSQSAESYEEVWGHKVVYLTASHHMNYRKNVLTLAVLCDILFYIKNNAVSTDNDWRCQ